VDLPAMKYDAARNTLAWIVDRRRISLGVAPAEVDTTWTAT
jgi:hypothetical protein